MVRRQPRAVPLSFYRTRPNSAPQQRIRRATEAPGDLCLLIDRRSTARSRKVRCRQSQAWQIECRLARHYGCQALDTVPLSTTAGDAIAAAARSDADLSAVAWAIAAGRPALEKRGRAGSPFAPTRLLLLRLGCRLPATNAARMPGTNRRRLIRMVLSPLLPDLD